MPMRKLRKQPVGSFNPLRHDLEHGDRVYQAMPDLEGAFMHDLRISTGRNKSDASELTNHIVKKDGKPRLAVLAEDEQWYWED